MEQRILNNPDFQRSLDDSFTDTAILDAAILAVTNIQRKKHGLKPFSFHPKLREMALLHSEQMRLHHFFDHENPFDSRYHTLTDRLNKVKDKNFGGFLTYGENLAQYPTLKGSLTFTVRYDSHGNPHCYDLNGSEMRPYTCLEYAKVVVEGWMHSPGHRANILNPKFEYLGCGSVLFQEMDAAIPINYYNLTQNFGGGEIRKTNACGDDLTPRPTVSIHNAFGGLATKNKSIMKNDYANETIMEGGYAPENGEEKTLCILELDHSGSMSGVDSSGESKMKQLNDGCQQLYDDILADERLSQMLEIAIVSFNHRVRVEQNPALVQDFTMPTLTAEGGTNLVDGVRQGIQLGEERKDYYKKHGNPYKCILHFPITDGQANVSPLIELVKEGTAQKHFHIIPIAIGDDADMDALNKIASNRAFKIKDGHISSFFVWLSNSLGTIANAAPGSEVTLENPYETFAVN